VFRPHPRQVDAHFTQAIDSPMRPPWRRTGSQTSYLLPAVAAKRLCVSEGDLKDWSRAGWLEARRAPSNGVLMYRWDEIVALKQIYAEHGPLTTELLRRLASQ
jgi:hypothetical protein